MSQLLMSQKLMGIHVCLEMRQGTLRLISMWGTSLFRGVLCWWMVNKPQTGGSKKIYVQNTKCNFHLLLKLKCSNTWCTSISIMNWGNSHISQNQNQANVTIMWKKTSITKLSWVWVELYALIRNFTTWKWTSKVEPHTTALAFVIEIFLVMIGSETRRNEKECAPFNKQILRYNPRCYHK